MLIVCTDVLERLAKDLVDLAHDASRRRVRARVKQWICFGRVVSTQRRRRKNSCGVVSRRGLTFFRSTGIGIARARVMRLPKQV